MANTPEDHGFVEQTSPEDLGFSSGQSTMQQQVPAQMEQPTNAVSEGLGIMANHSNAMRVLSDVMAGLSAGGKGLHDAPYNIASALSRWGVLDPGAAEAMPKLFKPIDYLQNNEISGLFGVTNPNLIDKGIQAAAQYAPYGMIGGATAGGQALGGFLAGATQSERPDIAAPLGALGGYGTAKLVGALPAAIGGAQKLYQGLKNKVNPEDTAQVLMQTLGKGKTLEDNAAAIGEKIQDAYKTNLAESKANYDQVFTNKVRNSKVDIDQYSPDMAENYLPDTKSVHEDFIKNPTVDNAHKLQSQLGYEIRDMQTQLSRGTLNRVDQATLQGLQGARNGLKEDMANHLDSLDPTGGLSDQFNKSTQYFAENVSPYRNNPTLAQIANGKITNSNKIMSNIPSLLKLNDIDKIASDVGPEFNDMIAYHKLGGMTKAQPDKVLSGIRNLEDKNSEYVTPTLAQLRDKLEGDVAAKNTRDAALKFMKRTAIGSSIAGVLGGVGYKLTH